MTLSQSLYLYASTCQENRDKLQDWFNDAIIKIAQGEGKTIASTTANGVSVTFMSNGLTLEDWANTLAEVIQRLNNPTKLRNKSVQIFR